MIYLVRHGQTDWNLEHRKQGQTDVPLNATGRNEAAICRKELARVTLERIISSDLSRAVETANIINESLLLPMTLDSRLRERNGGDLQGLTPKEISEETRNIFNNNPHQLHAESLEDFYNRVKSFFEEIDATKNTLVVTHGGTIRMAMYLARNPNSFNQEEFKKVYADIKIKNTAVFKWDKGQNFDLLP